MDITALITPAIQREELARVLDDVADDVRLKSLYELGRRDMARLFEASADNGPIKLDHFVPPGVPASTEVVHAGKNSLFLFRRFQKRFCRPSERLSELWGYNDHSLLGVTGPGYFIAYEDGNREIVIDYGNLPPLQEGALPRAWPTVTGNDTGLARLIYNGNRDVVRRISNTVSIGRVQRGARYLDVWFTLVRVTGKFSFTDPYPRP